MRRRVLRRRGRLLGTSTKRAHPRGTPWTRAATTHRELQDKGGDANADVAAKALRRALTDQLRQDPNAFNLRLTMQSGGRRLVAELDRLARRGTSDHVGQVTDGSTHERRHATFVKSFVDTVAGTGGTFADAAIRKAAVQAAEQLLANGTVRQAIEIGTDGGIPISRELFCLIYRMFFGHALEQFLTTVIAEGTNATLRAHVPMLPVIDPGDKIADWFAQNVVALLPTPCKDPAATGPSLAELGRELVTETVDQALGLPISGGAS